MIKALLNKIYPAKSYPFFEAKFMDYYSSKGFDKKGYEEFLSSLITSTVAGSDHGLKVIERENDLRAKVDDLDREALLRSLDFPYINPFFYIIKIKTLFSISSPFNEAELDCLFSLLFRYKSIQGHISKGAEVLSDSKSEIVLGLNHVVYHIWDNYVLFKPKEKDGTSYLISRKKYDEYANEDFFKVELNCDNLAEVTPDKEAVSRYKLKGMMNEEFSKEEMSTK